MYPKGDRLISDERDSFSRLGNRGRWPRLACWTLPPFAFASGNGSILGQRRYLLSFRTRGFPTSANFESKLAVRALMWSANNETPRSAGEVLNACVDCHSIVQLRIERNFIFQMSLEVGPISAPEIRAIRWVMRG